MVKFAAIACLALGTLAASAQSARTPLVPRGGLGATMHASLTGQFVVHEPDNPTTRPIPLGPDTGVHYIRVDPTLLTVSCERIKHALLTELNATDHWQDKIFIDLQSARTLDAPVTIAAFPFGRGWSYHLILPDTVENTRLVNSIVDVLLLEMANRKASGRSAELPAWLGYGLAEDIMRSSHIELVLETGKADAKGATVGTFNMDGRETNSLASARTELHDSPPLTLDQLSWPDDSNLDKPTGRTFRSSAQLFVHDLLQLKDGHAAMFAFIQELPQHLNWQLSFLHAFGADFGSQLELEKWWALQVVDFTGRDLAQMLNAEESWGKLETIVRPVVEVRTRAEELPMRTQVTLQAIIEKWDMSRQFGFLEEKSHELYLLRSRVSQEMAKLTDDYRRTIDVYLDKRRRDGFVHTARAQAVIGLDRVARQTIGDLNVLDSIREDSRPKPVALQSVDTRRNVNN